MNLGSIQDKTGNRILRKKTVTKILSTTAVCVCAAVAVFSAVTLSKKDSGNIPVLEAPSPTPKSASGNASVTGGKTSGTSGSTGNTDIDSSTGAADKASSSGTSALKMALPVSGGNILKGYASDMLVYSGTLKHWSTHNGIDLAANEGADVFAALDGTVESVCEDELMGTVVTLEHENGFKTVYASLGGICENIKEGAAVMKGQAVGTVGTTAAAESADAPHLHFEVFMNGKSVNPQSYLSGLSK